MLHHRILRTIVAAAITASLSLTSLLAEEPYAWPEKLPDSVINLVQTERPKIPKETGLSKEFGLELLTKALRPDTSLKSGLVLIEREKFLPKRLHAGRVPLIKIRLIFDRQVKPALWAQWTDGMKKQCTFIRGKDATYLSEQFPEARSRQRISKRNVDYMPRTKYCDEFPLFSFSYVPHFLMNHPKNIESFVKHSLEIEIDAVEKQGTFYLVHQAIKNTNPKSKYSEFHRVYWITMDESSRVVKMIEWTRLSQTGEWGGNFAVQNEFEKIEGIHVPKVYESYYLSQQKSEERVERIRLSWKDVNTPFPPELFNDDLLEPKSNSLLYDRTKKSDGVIGVPYGTLKKKKTKSE
ncbi:hypothetical protein [uncultured Gimesia sp.]|uniref:hypothetical protein n=1 Tax=uncultured Gimesia sp. TaxID=1678688 RepID=UPI0030DB1238